MNERERILGGLWVSLAGDALGVPLEFQNRAAVQSSPVTGMRGYGSLGQRSLSAAPAIPDFSLRIGRAHP